MEDTRSRARRGPRNSVAPMRPTMRYVGRSRLPYRVTVPNTPNAAADGRKVVGDWSRYILQITNRPGWSVDRLAAASGVHRATIYRWRSGEVTNVSVDRVKAIAQAAGDDESDALLAAGDAVSRPAEPSHEISPVGLLILSRMAAQNIQRPADLAVAADVNVDEVTAMMFRPETVEDRSVFGRVANVLDINPVDLDAALRGAFTGSAEARPVRDELVEELAAMLSADSPLSDAERRSLRALVDAAMQPYREKYASDSANRRVC